MLPYSSTLSRSAPARLLTVASSSRDDTPQCKRSPKRVCKTGPKSSEDRKKKTRSVFDTLLGYQKEDIERFKARSRELNQMLMDMSEIRLDDINEYFQSTYATAEHTEQTEHTYESTEEVCSYVDQNQTNKSSSSSNLDDFDQLIDVGVK